MSQPKKQSILILYDDDDGASFVLFDVHARVVYNDLIETGRVEELYTRFSVRATVSNRCFQPPNGTFECVDDYRPDRSRERSVHDPGRAVTFGTHVFANKFFSGVLPLHRLRRKEFWLPEEEWVSWLS